MYIHETAEDVSISRQAYYDTLFAGELPYEQPTSEAQVGVAALCRVTNRGGSRPKIFQTFLEELPGEIDGILISHDTASVNGGQAIFRFINVPTREIVSGIVTDIFTQWEVTQYRNRLRPLIRDTSPNARGLVIETAAAVMSTAVKENSFDIANSESDRKTVAKVISNWGPKFVQQWFDGTILTRWANEQQLSVEDTDRLLATFTPTTRKYIAEHNNSNPLEAVKNTWRNIEEVLTDSNIAAMLGLKEEDAMQVITPAMRTYLASNHSLNPLAALEKWSKGTISLGKDRDSSLHDKLAFLSK